MPILQARYLIIASHLDGNVKESLYSSYRVEIPPKDKEGRHEKAGEVRTLLESAQSPLATPSKRRSHSSDSRRVDLLLMSILSISSKVGFLRLCASGTFSSHRAIKPTVGVVLVSFFGRRRVVSTFCFDSRFSAQVRCATISHFLRNSENGALTCCVAI